MKDFKTSFDRVGDQSYKTTYGKWKVFVLCLIILSLMLLVSILAQDYLKSFHRTPQEARLPFTRISNVPTWSIVFKN